MDVLMQEVVDGSVKLCIDHNTPQSIIYERIRQALMDKVSNLPKQKVLYNACYGGFGFSKEFNAFFLKDVELRDSVSTRDYDKRQIAIPYIIPFADDVIQRTSSTCPYLRDMLYVVQKYNVNKLFADVNHIIKTENDLQLMARNVQSLRDYLQSNPTIPAKPMPISHWVLMFIKTNFLRYHPTELKHLLIQYDEGVLQKEYLEKLNSLEQGVKALLPDDDIYTSIKTFCIEHTKQEQGKENMYVSTRLQEKNSFIKLLKKYGVDSDVTWYHQTYYDKVAIAYIIKRYKNVLHVYEQYDTQDFASKAYDIFTNAFENIDEDVIERAKERFGLLCASSTYSKLQIASLAALLEWDVQEYDGLEHVNIV
jgi:hypothetical protein